MRDAAWCLPTLTSTQSDSTKRWGLVRFAARTSSGHVGTAPESRSGADIGAGGEGGMVPMYLNLKPGEY